MHDEFERAYTGKTKKGLSPLAWVFLAFGGIVGFGILALSVIGFFVAKQVQETIHQVETQLVQVGDGLSWEFDIDGEQDLSVPRRLAEALVSIDKDLEVVGSDENGRGLELLNRGTGDVSTMSYQDIIKGHLTINSDDGEIRFDLEGNEDGGSFVISGDDGDLFSMRLQTGDDGGRLVIQTDEGRSYFQAGEHAVDVPGWVPLYPEGGGERGVFSAHSGEGSGGAILVETTDSPEDVLDFYAERLEADGFEPSVTGHISQGDDFEAALTGHANGDDRIVGVFVGREDGVTRVLLTWGEGS